MLKQAIYSIHGHHDTQGEFADALLLALGWSNFPDDTKEAKKQFITGPGYDRATPITRQVAAIVIQNLKQIQPEQANQVKLLEAADDWTVQAIQALASQGIVDPDTTIHADGSFTFRPKDLLLRQESDLTGWAYSNTNAAIMGLIIKKVTGETYAEQIKKRIIEPLQLKETFLPGSSVDIPKKNARAYLNIGGKLVDITILNPSFANAGGEMISTGEDLTTFFRALLGGKLLKPEIQKEMMTSTADSPYGKYGLGIHGTKLPDGTIVWGHGGGFPDSPTLQAERKTVNMSSININVLGNADKHINDILVSEFAREAKKELKEEEKKSKHREEVKCVMDEVITNKRVPSIVAGGGYNGKRWSYATGTASYEVPRPVEPNFTFRIGSITKTFTASVVLQLAEKKQLNLNDSVKKWLPGVIKGNGYDGREITIRQLLNHTSGLASYTDSNMRDVTLPQNPFRYYTVDELISLALAKPPVFAPG